MAVPARKTSKQKKRSRRGHIKLSVPAMPVSYTHLTLPTILLV